MTKLGSNVPEQHLQRLAILFNPDYQRMFTAMRCMVNGVEATVLFLVEDQPNGMEKLTPQAILMSDELLDGGAITFADLTGTPAVNTGERNPESNMEPNNAPR